MSYEQLDEDEDESQQSLDDDELEQHGEQQLEDDELQLFLQHFLRQLYWRATITRIVIARASNSHMAHMVADGDANGRTRRRPAYLPPAGPHTLALPPPIHRSTHRESET